MFVRLKLNLKDVVSGRGFMAGDSISKIVVRVAVKKRYAYITIAVLFVILLLAGTLVLSSGIKDGLRDLSRLIGVGFLAILLPLLVIATVFRLKLSRDDRLKYVLASIGVSSLIIVILSYFSASSGILGFFTDDGSVPVSGEMGVAFRGGPVQAGLIVILSLAVIVLTLVPFDILKSIWKAIVDMLILMSRLRVTVKKDFEDSPIPIEYNPSEPAEGDTTIAITDRPDKSSWSLPPVNFDPGQHPTVIEDFEIAEIAEKIKNKLAE
ncbi:hypothetical protein M1N90_02545, partial [Dehalococcoidia bacterium]|nr:hypothetical protein [Dehalococcoidia bacterium]